MRQGDNRLSQGETKELQRLLRDQQYIVGPLDGVFGKHTQLALIRYQKETKRPLTGIADKHLLSELAARPPKPLTPPQDLVDTQACLWVELDKVRATLFVKGLYSAAYLVSIGKSTTPSPFGLWRVVIKTDTPGGAYGARWLGLDVPWGSYGVHGGTRGQHIGSHVTNGSIGMYNLDVAEVYEYMPIGGPVLFTGNPYGIDLLRRELKQGDMGSDVYFLQEKLWQGRLLLSKPDGIYGSETKHTVERYQQSMRLARTGVCDKATRARLFREQTGINKQ